MAVHKNEKPLNNLWHDFESITKVYSQTSHNETWCLKAISRPDLAGQVLPCIASATVPLKIIYAGYCAIDQAPRTWSPKSVLNFKSSVFWGQSPAKWTLSKIFVKRNFSTWICNLVHGDYTCQSKEIWCNLVQGENMCESKEFWGTLSDLNIRLKMKIQCKKSVWDCE